MEFKGPAKLVRVYLGESDRWQGKPLASAIVERARKEGLAGATVIRGVEGFGANSRIHTASILRLSEDLPVIVELVDSPETMTRFLPLLEEMMAEGLIIVQDCEVVKYVHAPR